MTGRVKRKLSLLIFWIVSVLAVTVAAIDINQLFVVPRALQRDLLGFTLGISALRSGFSSYSYDGSGMDLWTYEISPEMAADLRGRCRGTAQIQFYDPRNNFGINRPLAACTIPVAGSSSGSSGVEVRLAGTLLQFVRTTDKQ